MWENCSGIKQVRLEDILIFKSIYTMNYKIISFVKS